RVIGDLRADKVGLNAFLDLIAYAFQLDWLYASTKPSPPKKITMPGEGKVARKTVRRAESKSLMPPRAIVEPRATISINLAISPEVTPNMLKEYIKAMLKAYDEYFQERVEGAKAND
ncbi:MAG: hypothetical protein QW782_05375, partial [Candidatus Bathyarchaeia archaeon]